MSAPGGRDEDRRTLVRTGFTHRLLAGVVADLTGQDVSPILHACRSAGRSLSDVIVSENVATDEKRPAFVLRLLDRGTALGVLHGPLELVISLERSIDEDGLRRLAEAVASFRSRLELSAVPPRLLLRVPGEVTPVWPDGTAWRKDGEWCEIRLRSPARSRAGASCVPHVGEGAPIIH